MTLTTEGGVMAKRSVPKGLTKGVRAVLVKHDPIGLIEAGAPSDEYDSEADDIAYFASWMPKHNRDQMARTVQLVFCAWFGDEIAGRYGLDTWKAIADDVRKLDLEGDE